MADSVCPSGIRIENQITLSDQSILGNATQIQQVFLNICVNAVHAIGKKNEGRKNEEKTEGKIQISGNEMAYQKMDEEIKKHLNDTWEHYIHIQIRDNGCGMDSETLRQIFNPFFTTKKGGEGTGLGLALAEQIVISHKGYIYAEQNPSKYHGIGAFDKKTGECLPSQDSFSSVFGETLTKLARKDKKICAITAAMQQGTGLVPFVKEFSGKAAGIL